MPSNDVHSDKTSSKENLQALPIIKRMAVIRKVKGITQEQLAEYMNISRPSVANIEAGRQELSFTHFIKMNELLNVYRLVPTLDYEPVKENTNV